MQKEIMELIGYDCYRENLRTPVYTHDSDCCSYLGRFGDYDLYYCPQGNIPTVIMRFGDEGPMYYSGMTLAEGSGWPQAHPLIVAARVARSRAIQAGLYHPRGPRHIPGSPKLATIY